MILCPLLELLRELVDPLLHLCVELVVLAETQELLPGPDSLGVLLLGGIVLAQVEILGVHLAKAELHGLLQLGDGLL